MSKKENLIKEYFSLRHKFDINEGNNCLKPWPEIPSTMDFIKYSKEFKVIDLEEKVTAVRKALLDQENRINNIK